MSLSSSIVKASAKPIPNPPSRGIRRYQFTLILVDGLMLVLAFLLAYLLRFKGGVALETENANSDIWYYSRIIWLLVPMWLIFFHINYLYSHGTLLGGTKEYARAFHACTAGMILVVLATFVAPEFVVSRAWLVLSWLLSSSLIISSRFVCRRVAYRLRRQGYFVTPALIVGTNEEAYALAEQLKESSSSGLNVMGFVSVQPKSSPLRKNLPILGNLQDISALIKAKEVETIIVAMTNLTREELLRLYEQVALLDGVELHLSSGLFEVLTTGMEVRTIASVPFMRLKSLRLDPIEMAVKTFLDYILVTIGVISLLPLLALLALLVRLESSGPIIHRRRVMGMGGKPFDAFKFRTMVQNNQEVLDDYLAHHPDEAAHYHTHFKLENDPRITRIGFWLRRLSLDELPQLFNILLGQMSLVGPRMVTPEEIERYGLRWANLLTVKPGITGLWQVSGRSDISYEERVQLDMHYIRNYTIWSDLKILFVETLPAVIKGRGAY